MSSDDEELAALRAARVARGGGLTVVRKRGKEKETSLRWPLPLSKSKHPTLRSAHSSPFPHEKKNPALYNHEQTAQRQATMVGRDTGQESDEEEGGGGEERNGIDGNGKDADDESRRPPPPSSSSFRPPPLVLPDDDDDDDDGMAAAGLPMSFGGCGIAAAGPRPAFQKKKRPREEEEEEEKAKEQAPPSSSSGDEEDEEDEEKRDNPFNLPVSCSALFEPCERGVTCLALDRAGARLAAGSRDGRVRLFDFGGARSDLRPFRSFFPLLGGSGGGGEEGGDGEGAGATPPVVALCWLSGGSGEAGGSGGGGNKAGGGASGSGGGGGLLLVACSDARLVLCDREGRRLCESPRGDSYLADPKNTKGHTAPLTCCCFLGSGGSASGSGNEAPPPTSSSSSKASSSSTPSSSLLEVASGSEDGTVRIWTVLYSPEKDAFSLKQKVVIKVPATPGGGGGGNNKRTKVSALAFLSSSASAPSSTPSTKNPTLLVAGTDDGALHAWDPRSRKGRPAAAGAVVTGPTARMMGLAAKQQQWNFVAGVSSSTSRSVFGAHGGGGDRNSTSSSSYLSPCVTALAPPPAHLDDGTTVASRGEDGTVKVWDLSERSKAKKLPLVWSAGGSAGGEGERKSSSSFSSSLVFLPVEEPTTGLAWSPDGRVIATGTSESTVVFLEAGTGGNKGGALARSVSVAARIKEELSKNPSSASAPPPSSSSSSSTCSVVPICWHPKLNQLLLGISDPGATKNKLGGRVVALFSPRFSERGVLSALSRQKKRPRDQDGAVAISDRPSEIYNPHALPLYRAERSAGIPLAATGGSSRRSKEEAAAAAVAASAAHLPGRGGGGPALGAGSGGRLGVTGGTLLTQHVLKSRGGFGLVAPSEEGDIRQRMLAHGDLSKKDPSMAALTSAYRETQPERVFQKGGGKKGEGEGEEEGEEDE